MQPLKVFSLFISVKKITIFTKIFKKIFYSWRPFKISEDLEHILNISNLGKMQENMLKYTKKSLYCMFHLYFSNWRKMCVNLRSLVYVSRQVKKLTRNNYKNMIQAWLRSYCIVLHLCSFVSFWLKNKSGLIAGEKWIPILMHVVQLRRQP